MDALERDLRQFWLSPLGRSCRAACGLEDVVIDDIPQHGIGQGRNYAVIYRGFQAQGVLGVAKAIIYRALLDWKNRPKDAEKVSEELGF